MNTKIVECNSGCGRFFEGTAEEMHKALNGKLAKLPKETKVYVSIRDNRETHSVFLLRLSVAC